MKKKASRFFIGLLISIGYEILMYYIIFSLLYKYYLGPYHNGNLYLNSYLSLTAFQIVYPFLLSVLTASYFIFFKKNYALGIGIICGFFFATEVFGFVMELLGVGL